MEKHDIEKYGCKGLPHCPHCFPIKYNEEKVVPSDDLLQMANENRLLLFLESDEKDCFYQVMLSQEQFKKVSDAIFTESHKDPDLKEGYEMGVVRLSEEKYDPTPFDGLESVNPPTKEENLS